MHDNLAGLLIRGLVRAVVIVVFAFLRRFVPVKVSPEGSESVSLDGLGARFSSTNLLVYTGVVVVGLAVAWGLHFSLVYLSRSLALADGPYELALFPQTAIWWFLPGFAALTFSWEIVLGIWSVLGDKREVALFDYWTSAKAGFNCSRVLKIIGVVVVAPIAFFTVLALPEHSVLRGSDILARGYGFGEPQIYRYSEAQRLSVVEGYRNRDGSLQSRAAVVVDFSDGRRWSSDIGDFEPTVDPKLLELLEDKTGLQPQYFPTAQEIAK